MGFVGHACANPGAGAESAANASTSVAVTLRHIDPLAIIGDSPRAHASMTLATDLRAGFPDEKVEIDTAVGLQYGFAIELDPAARRMRRQRLPLGSPLGELFIGYLEVNLA